LVPDAYTWRGKTLCDFCAEKKCADVSYPQRALELTRRLCRHSSPSAGDRAGVCFVEFFTANILNPHKHLPMAAL
jgi:hypothetical protein